MKLNLTATGYHRVTCHIGSHSVTCHPTQVDAHPALTSATLASSRFTYPGRIEG